MATCGPTCFLFIAILAQDSCLELGAFAERLMGKNTHSHKRIYGRKLKKLAISVDYLLRKSLGFPPWRLNPQHRINPQPLETKEVLEILRELGNIQDVGVTNK